MNLPATSQGRVGIVTNHFESAYYGHMVEGASNYLMAQGYQAIVQSSLKSRTGELRAFKSLGDCHGLIIHADSLSDAELRELMQQTPCSVLLNRHLDQFDQRCVYVDNVLGGEIAANFLINQGHQSIAMVTGSDKHFGARERTEGFIAALEKNNLTASVILNGNFHQRSGDKAIHELREKYPEVTAVFFQNDEMAFGALTACRALSVKVPEDISIIGFDGLPMCDYVSPKLTSVQQPLWQIGEHAARVVCDLMQGVSENKRVVGSSYKPVLAERESVAQPKGHIDETVSLSSRERECLLWTAYGKTSWEISVILGVSESTATFHLRNAGSKLHASNRAHAVAKALHHGLIIYGQEE